MTADENYLKNELYSLVKSDSSLFDFLQEGSLDGLWYWNLDKPEHEWMSPRFWTLLGYDPNEKQHLASEWQDLIFPEDLEIAIDNFNKHCVDSSHPYDQVVRYKHKNGSTIWVRCRGFAIRNDKGKPVRMLGAHTDLTPQKQAEEDLTRNLRLFENFFHKSFHLAVILDEEGNITETNERLIKVCGTDAVKVIGKPLWDAGWWKQFPDVVEKTKIAIGLARKGQATSDEVRLVDQNNTILHGLRTFSPITDTDGRIVQITAVWLDITDRKRAEGSLQKSEEKYRKLYEDAAIGIFHSSFEGRFLDVNPTLAMMLGYETPQDVVDSIHNISEQIYAEPQVRDEVIAKLLAKGETVKVENRYRRKDGLEWNAYLHLRCVADSKGIPICLEGFVEDITDRKRVEEELKESMTFLENMTDIAYMADDNGKILWVNPAVKGMTGLPPEEIINKPFVPLFIESDHASLIDVYKRTLAGESLENTLTFKSGITCHFTSLPKRNQKGDIVGTFGVARDISERLVVERALQTNEARLKKAQKMAKVGNWEYDIATGKVWGSEEVFRIYGIEQTSDFLPLEVVERYIVDAKRVNQALENLITRNKNYDIEFQINSKNREGLINIHSMADLVCDEDGKPIKVVGVIQDITERKQAEESLHKSYEMLTLTEAMANIGSWEWDVQHDRTHWSEELFRIFGRHPAEGAPPFAQQSEFYANEDMERLKDAVETCVKRGMPYEIELRAIRADGEIRHCVSRGQAQYDETGKVFRLVGSFQDITERKRIELALKESEERFKALHNASFGGIAIHAEGFILECNRGLSEITGYTQNELVGMNLLYLISDGARDMVAKSIDTRYEKPYEATGVRKNGELYPLRLEARNIPYKENNARVAEFRDITEQKRAEKEKKDLEEKFRQAQKMEAVGRLAGGIAHDFNNMLTVIIGHTEMALADLNPSLPLYKKLKEVKKAGKRSADLTRQLLGFARKQTVSPRVIDLNKTVATMTNMLQRLIGEDIDLVWTPKKDIWPVRIDPSQIDQILANLCVNARDAIADVGKVTIETVNYEFNEAYCSVHPEFLPGEYVLLAVSDNGCGIDAEILDKIFEPFFTTKETGKGTGFGLATVYGVVKQNNGFIYVYSELGHGTTFKIYLPRYKAKPETLSEKVENFPTEHGNETVLLVEDEIAILSMTTQMLERLGYQVVAARTPGEAVRLAREHTGDLHLLLTDVVMPEMNGRDLARNLLSLYPNLKRLFMSGYTANVIAHHGILDEGVHFIQKPFSVNDLAVKIREVLDKDVPE